MISRTNESKSPIVLLPPRRFHICTNNDQCDTSRRNAHSPVPVYQTPPPPLAPAGHQVDAFPRLGNWQQPGVRQRACKGTPRRERRKKTNHFIAERIQTKRLKVVLVVEQRPMQQQLLQSSRQRPSVRYPTARQHHPATQHPT